MKTRDDGMGSSGCGAACGAAGQARFILRAAGPLTTILVLLLGLDGTFAGAREVPWVKTPPSLEELSRGALKPGDSLTKEKLEAASHLIPNGMDVIMKELGVTWTIVETTPPDRLLYGSLIDATLANAGKAVVSPEGTVSTKDGSAWPGGFPVLEPKSGVEVMANGLYKETDTHYDLGRVNWTNSAGEVYKRTYGVLYDMRASGRTCQDPKPAVPGWEDEIRRELIRFTEPYDVRGVAIFSIIYRDQLKLPDTWAYVPVLRRVQRFSSGQRYDSTDGSDVRVGDIDVFNDPLGLWELKLVERKPFLAAISEKAHTQLQAPDDTSVATMLNAPPLDRINGKLPADPRLEVRDTFVVEAVPKDPTHIYSKKVMYVDAATYWIWWAVAYDRQGALWYIQYFPRGAGTSPCGPFTRAASGNYYNVQTGSGTFVDLLRWAHVPSQLVNENIFTLRFLSTQGR